MNISLIIPAYNEQENIKRGILNKTLSYFKNKNYQWEILIVDDGSTDNTISLIENRFLQDKRIKLIKKNHQGKAFSIIEGIKHAAYETIVFSDFDMATPINEIEKLSRFISNYDIVIGSRKSIREGAPLKRKILAKGFILIRDLFINLQGIHDTQCGFKMFKKTIALKIINNLKVFKHGYKINGASVSAGFDLEFLYLAKKMGFRVKEVFVEWHYAETRRVSFIKDSLETLKDILKIKIYEYLGKYSSYV